MVSIDVNILVHAFRDDASDHLICRNWLKRTLGSGEALGLSNVVLSGFLRIVTHPRVFETPTPLDAALKFVRDLRSSETVIQLSPGPDHWEIFDQLCRLTNARGNLIPDAYLAALAIESDSDWISLDRDFGRFPRLRWRKPS